MKVFIYGLQWVVFHSGVIVSAPVVLGAAFQLGLAEIGSLMQLTFFLTGFASLLQIYFGHGHCLIEGAAPPWWTGSIVLVGLAVAVGKPLSLVRTDIEGAMMVSGAVLVLLGMSGVIRRFGHLLTPRITGVLLLLMSLQIGTVGIKGLFSHGFAELGLGLLVLILIFFLLFKTSGFLRQGAILFGVIIGWIAYLVIGFARFPAVKGRVVTLPPLFLWGSPTFDFGTVLTLLILGILLIPNVAGSLKAMEASLGQKIPMRQYDKGLAVNGAACFFSGLTGGIGTIPFAISAGLVSVTGGESRKAFILASVLFMLFGVLAPLGKILSGIPLSLASAVLLLSVSSLVVIGVKNLTAEAIGKRETFIIGFGVITGAGIMSLPVEMWKSLPVWAMGIASNGAIMGTLLTIFLEHGLLNRRFTKESS